MSDDKDSIKDCWLWGLSINTKRGETMNKIDDSSGIHINDFVQELYAVCKKYKKNLSGKFDVNNQQYKIDISAEWDIVETCNAVEVYTITEEFNFSIKGDIKSKGG